MDSTKMNQPQPMMELEALLGQPPPATWLDQFREGTAMPWHGWNYLRRRPKLWRYAVLPVVLNIIITGLILLMLIAAVIWFARTVHPRFTADRTGWEWWLALAGEVAAAVALLFLCAVIAIILWKLLNGVLCGYFYGKLAYQVELDLGLPPERIRSISFGYELMDTVASLTLLLAINFGFLLLNIVPGIGGLIAMVGGAYCNWLLLGVDYLGYPLALRGNRRFVQLAFARQHQAHTLGLGATVFLFQFVPIVGAVLLTTAAVGAVLLYRRLEQLDGAGGTYFVA